jgi:hypothetical protein
MTLLSVETARQTRAAAEAAEADAQMVVMADQV